MPFDGSGNFNRNFPPGGWQGDATANIKIMADRHDIHDKDLADGLTNCITKDGQSQPTANIPMNGKRLINMADPESPDDAATKKFVETITGWTTSKTISGADLNGRLIFSGTGVTGIQWTAADLSWVAKTAKASETSHRLVMNNKADATGTDVFVIDDRGALNNNGQITNNLSWDGAAWRTISPGLGALLNYAASGDLRLSSNDVASITNPYVSVTLREFFTAQNSAGNAVITLNKSLPISGVQKAAQILAYRDSKLRWRMDMGNATAETATDRIGSDFYLWSYNNAGTGTPIAEMYINRSTHKVTFTGDISTSGEINTDSVIRSTDTTMIIASASGGNIYLRPNGSGSAVEQATLNSNGDWIVEKDTYTGNGSTGLGGGTYLGLGFRSKAGSTDSSYQTSWMNLDYVGGFVYVYVNSTNMGAITWQSDHRMKKNVQKLHSTWEAVKALNPVKYKHKKYKDITEDEDVERWGFLAHELQEKLTPSAAFGKKDEENVLQSVNPLTLIATLTRALQEAMERIELLEAKKA